MEPAPEPCAIVIFGASGDLTRRKLLPSLFHLHLNNLLPKQSYVLGISRTRLTQEEFREKARQALPKDQEAGPLESFLGRLRYLSGDFSDPSFFRALARTLKELDEACGVRARRLFYLSTPPSSYPVIAGGLGQAGLARPSPDGWARLVVEKPFGADLLSAQRLNEVIHRSFGEDQVYRIDHYLGKETVQNILMLRFANTLFEPAWNRNTIDHVQITAAETLGIEERSGYYEQSGVLRDMFQNHLLQLLALVAMEPPSSFEPDSVRDRKVDVFKSIRPLREEELAEDVLCAQYAAGTIGGQAVAAYREEKGVSPDSKTPTFAALKLGIDNWRWQGVPFYLRSGKRLARRATEIAVQFKRVPVSIFRPLLADHLAPNLLRLRIQPEEGISMRFETKHPGPKLCISSVSMHFDYRETFGTPPPESYTRLFLDAMIGDQTLFARSDGVEQSWRVLDPILRYREAQGKGRLLFYPAESWGPPESADLLARDGREWHIPHETDSAE